MKPTLHIFTKRRVRDATFEFYCSTLKVPKKSRILRKLVSDYGVFNVNCTRFQTRCIK